MQFTISKLLIYPIKSLGGVPCTSASALRSGLEHDRYMMLVDDKNQFLTQRGEAKLALFKMQKDGDEIEITNGDQAIRFSLAQEENNKQLKVQVWNDKVEAISPYPLINEWFSDMLKKKVTLVRKADVFSRHFENDKSNGKCPVSFADGYPYLILGEGSLNFLNAKLKEPIPMNRFRPNIVLNTEWDGEEDGWVDYTIGEVPFRNMRKCFRCNVTTINQETGKKGKEPLSTLTKYRYDAEKQHVFFGMNAIVLEEGELNVKDQLHL